MTAHQRQIEREKVLPNGIRLCHHPFSSIYPSLILGAYTYISAMFVKLPGPGFKPQSVMWDPVPFTKA